MNTPNCLHQTAWSSLLYKKGSRCRSLGDDSMYSFLEEMDHCVCHLHHHHHLPHSLSVPILAKKMPVSPSPVITSTRPKSTMLHALPLHMVNYLLLLRVTSSKLATGLHPACHQLQTSRMSVAPLLHFNFQLLLFLCFEL